MKTKKSYLVFCDECGEMNTVGYTRYNNRLEEDPPHLCLSCAKKGKKNGVWKGREGKYWYTNIHKHIRNVHGNAQKCENEDCPGTSEHYDWHCLEEKYTTDISDYAQLCRSCHVNYERGNINLKINSETNT